MAPEPLLSKRHMRIETALWGKDKSLTVMKK